MRKAGNMTQRNPHTVLGETDQATAEYALVIVAAAAIALALIVWATSTGALSDLFDTVVAKVTSYV